MSQRENIVQRRVLLVDDDPRYTDLLHFTLETEGFEVFIAQNAAKGLALAKSHCPDVIVTDVAMPEIDGYALAAGLKSDPSTAEIPVVFVTARGHETDRWAGQSIGAAEYLTKPFSISELVGKLKNICERTTEKHS